MDDELNVFSLRKNQYIKLGSDEYKVVDLNESDNNVNGPDEPDNPDYDPIPFMRPVPFQTIKMGLTDFWELEMNCPRVGFESRKF
jgi:hypothetical protein